MSSGGALPPTSFNHFPYLFPTQPHFFTPNQRMKMKRQRQRVDAGEPRNSYQQPRVPPKQDNASPIQQTTALPLNVTQLFPNLPWMQMVNQLSDQNEVTNLPSFPLSLHLHTHFFQIQDAMEDSVSASESTSSSPPSSSRRKSNFPQKASSTVDAIDDETGEIKTEIQEESDDSPSNAKLNEILDAQKSLYSSLMNQHKDVQEKESTEMAALAATLKKEIMSSISGSIDKIISDWMSNQKKGTNGVFPVLPSLLTNSSSTSTSNPFGMTAGSIFPPPFNPFLANHINGIRKEDDNRKRKLEMPSVRSKMTASPSINTPSSDRAISPIMSGTLSLPSYFPSPIMGHPLYDLMESPFDSDDDDGAPYDPSMPQSSTLTPMHLRKAKLMFFFTRYPNSSVLKQFFPDIRFNKNNTAQLVKWFSNFREFYYNQMDKYAKQTVAEGIQKREDIIVTRDSEIFKQLNQHYNRNNHIQTPDRLVWVVQESLREFYEAIKLGRHNEPSWKKHIYKIICRFDDPIPDYFKDANFLDKLE
ncbi:hypothetical protein PFISCL1PPCAC_10458, partial [Pristionchus fissidentatus]